LTYAEAVWSQKLPDWIAAHVRAFAYFGASPAQTVSDNPKTGITKPWRKRGSCSGDGAEAALGFGWADVTVTQVYTILTSIHSLPTSSSAAELSRAV
jgi:hypothetical protein